MAIVQAAQVAIQGLKGLGEGLGELGEARKRGKQANLIKDIVPGKEGELLAGDVQRGGTATDVLAGRTRRLALSPQQMVTKFTQIAMDPNTPKEERQRAKLLVSKMVNLLKTTRSGGGGSGAGSTLDKVLGKGGVAMQSLKAAIREANRFEAAGRGNEFYSQFGVKNMDQFIMLYANTVDVGGKNFLGDQPQSAQEFQKINEKIQSLGNIDLGKPKSNAQTQQVQTKEEDPSFGL